MLHRVCGAHEKKSVLQGRRRIAPNENLSFGTDVLAFKYL